MKRSVRANLLLTLTALIWGAAFVAQDVAADSLGSFTFNGLRMALAALAMLPVIAALDRKARKTGQDTSWRGMTPAQRRTLLTGGVCCGAMLALASAFQQMGIAMGTGAGKAGFITALYIVLVPIFGIFLKKRVPKAVWVSVLLAVAGLYCLAVLLSVAGLYLLCIGEDFSIAPGDGLLILCALCFSGHILVVDHFSRLTDCVKMSCLQFATAAVLCMGVAVFTEPIDAGTIVECALPLLYAGVLSGAVGYTLQIVAQKDTDPTVASLLMSLESVFAVLAGALVLHQIPTGRELAGCVLMFVAIVLAQRE